MANKRLLLVLLFLLSSVLLLTSVQSTNPIVNGTEPIQARDDDSEDKPNRPSVKKWFNSLLASNSQGAKKSPSPSSSYGGNSSATTTSSSPSHSSPRSPYLVPVPVPVASPAGAIYPYQMSYSPMPYMAYPYSHSSSRAAVVPLSMSPYPVMASPRSKDRLALHPGYPHASHELYMASPHIAPYGFDSQGYAYAIPVPMVPYLKSYMDNRSGKYKSKSKSMKSFEDKPHLEQISDTDENNGVESRNKELFTPTFEPNDHMEPFEESEYTNESGHEVFEGEDRDKH